MRKEIRCIEDAIARDIRESKKSRDVLAPIYYKDSTPENAGNKFDKLLLPDTSPHLQAEQAINILIDTGYSENTMRYICEKLGYKMPERQDNRPTAEIELTQVKTDFYENVEALLKKMIQMRDLEKKTGNFKG